MIEKLRKETMARTLRYIRDYQTADITGLAFLCGVTVPEMASLLDDLIRDGFLSKNFRLSGYSTVEKADRLVQGLLFGP